MPTRTEQCYRLLKDRILDGTYGPGHRLVIDQLGRETQISTIPWRESLRRLEAEGWVEIIPNVGARVASFDADEWTRTMRLLARLEGYATAVASPNLSADALTEAEGLNQAMADALVEFDPVGFTRLNRRFHELLCAPAEDLHLHVLLETEWARLDVIRRSVFTQAPGRAAASVAEHQALLDLLRTGAGLDRIEAAATQHKLNTLTAVLRHDRLAS